MFRVFQAAILVIAVSAVPALAQDSLSGTINGMEGSTLTITGMDGINANVMIGADTKVIGLTAAKLTDVKVGDFVGVGSIPGADGGQNAVEITIFPAAMAGTGEGSYPWETQPQGTMTNATVSNAVTTVGANSLTLKYAGGEKTVAIPPEIPVVLIGAATVADLVSGAAVKVAGVKDATGAMVAKFVIVGRDGVVPPM